MFFFDCQVESGIFLEPKLSNMHNGIVSVDVIVVDGVVVAGARFGQVCRPTRFLERLFGEAGGWMEHNYRHCLGNELSSVAYLLHVANVLQIM